MTRYTTNNLDVKKSGVAKAYPPGWIAAENNECDSNSSRPSVVTSHPVIISIYDRDPECMHCHALLSPFRNTTRTKHPVSTRSAIVVRVRPFMRTMTLPPSLESENGLLATQERSGLVLPPSNRELFTNSVR